MDPPATVPHHCLCNTWGGTPHPEWCPEKQKEKSQSGTKEQTDILSFICWLMLQPRLATLLGYFSWTFRRVAFIPGCVVWGFSTSGHALCPGWCSSVSAGVLWEPHIAFPCTGIRLSEAPSREMYKTKKTFIFKTDWLESCCWQYTVWSSYLLSRNCVFLEEKVSKLCVLFGCVAWTSIPAKTVS